MDSFGKVDRAHELRFNLRGVVQEGMTMTATRSAGHALVVASMLCCASSSTAYIALPKESLAQKVAFADCVVLGKITAIQDKPAEGKGEMRGRDFTIADVEIKESLYGAKDKSRSALGFPTSTSRGPSPA